MTYTQIIIHELGNWVQLLKHPACYQNKQAHKFDDMLKRIETNPTEVKPLLVDGNIWGGMGSFLDSAMLSVFYYKPTSTLPDERVKEWEVANQKCFDWNIQFYQSLVNLGTAILNLYSQQNRLTELEIGMIDRWIKHAKNYIETGYHPLKPINIKALENNLRFHD